jgi:hypothetical protein
MIYDEKQINKVKNLEDAFYKGQQFALKVLQKYTSLHTHTSNSYSSFHKDGNCFLKKFIPPKKNYNLVITTEVFGELKGKSYLFMNYNDVEKIFDILKKDSHYQNFQFEFLKEMDNILSAAVITIIANELNIQIYGDVPTLIYPLEGGPDNLINEEFFGESEKLFVKSITFNFDNTSHSSLYFLWRVKQPMNNVKILE